MKTPNYRVENVMRLYGFGVYKVGTGVSLGKGTGADALRTMPLRWRYWCM